MTIPKYDEIIPHALRYLAEHGETRYRDLEQPLAADFGLTQEELEKPYASGNGTVFLDRISWALSYLNMANLVEKPGRGLYKAAPSAESYLEDDMALRTFVRQKAAEHTARKQRDREQNEVTDASPMLSESAEHLTPLDTLNAAFDAIRTETLENILDTILSKSPYELEKLVVKLLGRMGYGGQIKDSGQVTQASNDGGIDGIIKEDVLGFGRVHIQVKRYARDNSVGREDIQGFVGALAVAQSNKGVYITTSRFTSGAKEYARSLNGSTHVVLIDGMELARYIYDYGLGMQVEQVIELKKLDADFWDEMKDA